MGNPEWRGPQDICLKKKKKQLWKAKSGYKSPDWYVKDMAILRIHRGCYREERSLLCPHRALSNSKLKLKDNFKPQFYNQRNH